MSNAGQMAVDIVFRGNLPVRGFITFCCTNPKLSDYEISTLKGKNVKGVLIAGINDNKYFNHSVEMHDQLLSSGFDVKLETGNFRHEIPEDSYAFIDNAAEYILKVTDEN